MVPVYIVFEDCVAIADHIKCTTSSLKELYKNKTQQLIIGRDDKGLEVIIKALAENQSLPLKRLVVKWICTLTDAAKDFLAQFISNAITLQYIVILWCAPSAHELLELARAMYDKSTLREKTLEVFSCRANSDDEAKDLAQLLIEYPHNVVFVNHNAIMITQISDAGAVALAQALHDEAPS